MLENGPRARGEVPGLEGLLSGLLSDEGLAPVQRQTTDIQMVPGNRMP
jgi:hypothetical protein